MDVLFAFDSSPDAAAPPELAEAGDAALASGIVAPVSFPAATRAGLASLSSSSSSSSDSDDDETRHALARRRRGRNHRHDGPRPASALLGTPSAAAAVPPEAAHVSVPGPTAAIAIRPSPSPAVGAPHHPPARPSQIGTPGDRVRRPPVRGRRPRLAPGASSSSSSSSSSSASSSASSSSSSSASASSSSSGASDTSDSDAPTSAQALCQKQDPRRRRGRRTAARPSADSNAGADPPDAVATPAPDVRGSFFAAPSSSSSASSSDSDSSSGSSSDSNDSGARAIRGLGLGLGLGVGIPRPQRRGDGAGIRSEPSSDRDIGTTPRHRPPLRTHSSISTRRRADMGLDDLIVDPSLVKLFDRDLKTGHRRRAPTGADGATAASAPTIHAVVAAPSPSPSLSLSQPMAAHGSVGPLQALATGGLNASSPPVSRDASRSPPTTMPRPPPQRHPSTSTAASATGIGIGIGTRLDALSPDPERETSREKQSHLLLTSLIQDLCGSALSPAGTASSDEAGEDGLGTPVRAARSLASALCSQLAALGILDVDAFLRDAAASAASLSDSCASPILMRVLQAMQGAASASLGDDHHHHHHHHDAGRTASPALASSAGDVCVPEHPARAAGTAAAHGATQPVPMPSVTVSPPLGALLYPSPPSTVALSQPAHPLPTYASEFASPASLVYAGASPAPVYSRYLQEFEDLGLLGRGGFGRVAKARNRLDGVLYAIKTVSLTPANSAAARQRRRQSLAYPAPPRPSLAEHEPHGGHEAAQHHDAVAAAAAAVAESLPRPPLARHRRRSESHGMGGGHLGGHLPFMSALPPLFPFPVDPHGPTASTTSATTAATTPGRSPRTRVVSMDTWHMPHMGMDPFARFGHAHGAAWPGSVAMPPSKQEMQRHARLQVLLREVKIQARLQHPNVVRYHSAWFEYDDGTLGQSSWFGSGGSAGNRAAGGSGAAEAKAANGHADAGRDGHGGAMSHGGDSHFSEEDEEDEEDEDEEDEDEEDEDDDSETFLSSSEMSSDELPDHGPHGRGADGVAARAPFAAVSAPGESAFSARRPKGLLNDLFFSHPAGSPSGGFASAEDMVDTSGSHLSDSIVFGHMTASIHSSDAAALSRDDLHGDDGDDRSGDDDPNGGGADPSADDACAESVVDHGSDADGHVVSPTIHRRGSLPWLAAASKPFMERIDVVSLKTAEDDGSDSDPGVRRGRPIAIAEPRASDAPMRLSQSHPYASRSTELAAAASPQEPPPARTGPSPAMFPPPIYGMPPGMGVGGHSAATDIVLFIQMELCGENLSSWIIKRNKTHFHRATEVRERAVSGAPDGSPGSPSSRHLPLSSEMRAEALSIFRDIAKGLSYLHENAIVHRDLKPANIYRSLEDPSQWKIGDFGLVASELDEQMTTTTTSTTNRVYMHAQAAASATMTTTTMTTTTTAVAAASTVPTRPASVTNVTAMAATAMAMGSNAANHHAAAVAAEAPALVSPSPLADAMAFMKTAAETDRDTMGTSPVFPVPPLNLSGMRPLRRRASKKAVGTLTYASPEQLQPPTTAASTSGGANGGGSGHTRSRRNSRHGGADLGMPAVTTPTGLPGEGPSTDFLGLPTPFRPSLSTSPQSLVPPAMPTVAHSPVSGPHAAPLASPTSPAAMVTTTRSDMFSLGVLLLELLVPFGTGMERARTLSDLRHRGILPSEFVRDMPKEATLVLWLTSPRPEQRPSARQVLEFRLFASPPAPSMPVHLHRHASHGSASGATAAHGPHSPPAPVDPTIPEAWGRMDDFNIYHHIFSGNPSPSLTPHVVNWDHLGRLVEGQNPNGSDPGKCHGDHAVDRGSAATHEASAPTAATAAGASSSSTSSVGIAAAAAAVLHAATGLPELQTQSLLRSPSHGEPSTATSASATASSPSQNRWRELSSNWVRWASTPFANLIPHMPAATSASALAISAGSTPVADDAAAATDRRHLDGAMPEDVRHQAPSLLPPLIPPPPPSDAADGRCYGMSVGGMATAVGEASRAPASAPVNGHGAPRSCGPPALSHREEQMLRENEVLRARIAELEQQLRQQPSSSLLVVPASAAPVSPHAPSPTA